LHPPPEPRPFRIDDADHPGRHRPAETAAARAASARALAREEEEEEEQTEGLLSDIGGVYQKLKAGAGDAMRAAKAGTYAPKGAYRLACFECKDRGDPPSLDAVAHTDVVDGASVPVVVVAPHKQWKNSKTVPGFSVPKHYTNDPDPYISDFVGGKRGNPSGRFPFPPTIEGRSDEAHALQSFRDIVFAAGMRKATYFADDDSQKDAGRLSAMGKGHPAAVVAKDGLGETDGLQYPYSCVRNALLQGGNGHLLQYVAAAAPGAPPQENLPSVLPFPGNGKNLSDSCVYTAMAAVWIPYGMPGLWSRYACIFVPIGANSSHVAMGHAIFVPHTDYGVVSPPTDANNAFYKWVEDEASSEFEKRNYRGERGTISIMDANLPGYDLIGAYAVDANMAIAADSAAKGYVPKPVLASEALILPYLAPALDAFVKKHPKLDEARRSVEAGGQVKALLVLNETFRVGEAFGALRESPAHYRTYTLGLVDQVAGFDVTPPHKYDYAMLDVAARAARVLMKSKATIAGRALGLPELLADYKQRKKGLAKALAASPSLQLNAHDYDRKTGAGFETGGLVALQQHWGVCEF
jgi:hypothetical protein